MELSSCSVARSVKIVALLPFARKAVDHSQYLVLVALIDVFDSIAFCSAELVS